MKLIVVGCGRQGAQLAQTLSQSGHTVTIIDQNAENLKRLGSNFKGQIMQGVVFDRTVLINAGIERADGLAAVTNNDDANIVTALLARNVFRVPQVVARVYDPRQLDIYGRLGLQTISPISLGVIHIIRLLTGAKLETIMTFGNGEMEIVQIEVPMTLVGRQVSQLQIPSEISVVAITRQNKAFMPTQGTVLQAGDALQIAVMASSHERLYHLLGMN